MVKIKSNNTIKDGFDTLLMSRKEKIMLILFIQIMTSISIIIFGWFFFFGKVTINGFISNKVSHAFLGALWFTFIVDLVLFIPVGMIIILANM